MSSPPEKNIWQAASTGDPAALASCLNRKQKPKTKRVPVATLRDNHNWTLLHHAVASGNLECVELILSRTDVDVGARCYEGQTALLVACARDVPLAIVERLLERDGSLVSVGNNEDVTPLHKAAEGGNLELVEMLVARGADLNALDYAGDTPIYGALSQCHVEIVIHLLFVGHAWVPGGDDLLNTACYRGMVSDVRRKEACFRLLFNYMLSRDGREYAQRYCLEDISRAAACSYHATCLIPHFVDTALLWETDPARLELIKYLHDFPMHKLPKTRELDEVRSKGFHWLRFLLAYHDEMVANRETDCMASGMAWISVELTAFSVVAILDESNEALQMLLKYLESTKDLTFQVTEKYARIVLNIRIELMGQEKDPRFCLNLARYDAVVSRMVELFPYGAKEMLLKLSTLRLRDGHLKFLRPVISYCEDSSQLGLHDAPFWKELALRYGPLESAQNLKGFKFSEFTLRRLSRDVVRRVVLAAIPKDQTRRDLEFVRRLTALELPANLIRYLRLL